MNVAVTLVVVIGVQLFAEPLILLFGSTSPEVVNDGVYYLRVCCGINSLIYAVMYTLDSFAIGVGAANVAMINALLDAVIVRLPVSWILAFALNMGFSGIYYGQALSPVLPAIVGLLYFISRKWEHKTLIQSSHKGGKSLMDRMVWLLCPVCGNKTRLKVRQDTELINFPLYCPKCKQETLVNVKKSKLSVIRMANLISKEDRRIMMDKQKIYPRSKDRETVYLKNVVTDPSIIVGDYTMYNDFVNDPVDFQKNNVLYHYPINHDRLIIGKFCSIACGARFLFNSANHSMASLATYPFPIFFEEWGLDVSHITEAWDNKGDIVIGSDVWIGYEAVDFRWSYHRGWCHYWHQGCCNKRCPALYHCGRCSS